MNNKTVKTIIPPIRAEKTGNKNKDDFRVLLAGSIICVVMVWGQSVFMTKNHDSLKSENASTTSYVESSK